MFFYWVLYLVPVVGMLSTRRFALGAHRLSWWLAILFLTCAIGLRYQVGGDWYAYIGYFERASSMALSEILLHGDPGYYLVNWVAHRLGGSIYMANLISGFFLVVGIVAFAKRQPLPWLALIVAVPYLIIVVGMGYTRQAVALGFALLGLAALSDGKMRGFIVWVLIGAAFHKSAVLMLPIAALASSEKRLWNLLWVGVISLLGAYLFLFDSVDTLWANYVEASYESQGGLIRVLMNAVPAVLFLFLHRRFDLSKSEYRLWWWMSILALICIPLVLLSSTATDRVALYLIPLQLFVFSRLHILVGNKLLRAYILVFVASYYAAVQAVWLLFASHAHAWLPYQMYPFAS